MLNRAIVIGDVERVVLLLLLALVVALAARRLRFPYTLALVLVGLLLGVFRILPEVEFRPDLVLFLFLPALLFEGAWSIRLEALRADWLPVLLLAVPGLMISLGVVALVVHVATGLPWVVAILLGAIISPTDPVAVIGLLRQLGMPERLRTIIEGESLFNDGIGAAAYELALGVLLLLGHLGGELTNLPTQLVALKGLWLVIGGPILGFAIGFVVSRTVRHVDDHLIETTVTFSVAYGSYILAVLLGTSGLLAVVAAGLTLGSYGRRIGMSRRTRDAVDNIWEFTSYLANSLLFLILGHQIGAVSVNGAVNVAGALSVIAWTVAAVFIGRALMLYLLLPLHDRVVVRLRHSKKEGSRRRKSHPEAIPLLWRPLILLSGLRGALSLALALSLTAVVPQEGLLKVTVYGVVLVTLVGQGIALRVLLPRWPIAKASTPSMPSTPPASSTPPAPPASSTPPASS